MKDQKESYESNTFVDNILKDKKGKMNFKYFSPIIKPRSIIPPENFLANKINLKELSKISNKPIFVNTIKQKIKNERYVSVDKSNINQNYSSMANSTRFLEYENKNINYFNTSNNKKNIVIFTERPKKISDYILKNKSKQKVYQLTYLNENDLKCQKYFNEKKLYQNTNSNRNYYNPRLIRKQKKMFSYNTYNDHNNLINDVYSNDGDNSIYKSSKNFNNYSFNSIYSNNQNNDQLKVVKIQSMWRGHKIRKFIIKSLNNYYHIMKFFNCLYTVFSNNYKPIYKQFISLYIKTKNVALYNRMAIKNKKTKLPSYSSRPRRENKNVNNPTKENINRNTIIDKKNINVFIPGEKKEKRSDSKKNFVYVRKKSLPKNSPLFSRRSFKKDNKVKSMGNNMKLREKINNHEPFKNINSKNTHKDEINNIIKYIIKKNILLYFPLFLYRLKILQKIKLIECKYKCLFNLIKIKEKLFLFPYFKRYRNNIISLTVKQMLDIKNVYTKKENLNHSDNKDINNNFKINKYILGSNGKYNSNNNKFKLNKIMYSNKTLLKSNDKTKNTNKKYILLKRLINKKESKINMNLLKKIFNKWIIIIKNNMPIPTLRQNKFNSSKLVFNKYKSTEVSKKKYIKVKKIKSDTINNFSHTKSTKKGEISMNSYESDNINAKKMKIHKINVLTQPKETTKSLINHNNSTNIDNAFFIRKIAIITRKISNKNSIFNCFNYWKKKTKDNK